MSKKTLQTIEVESGPNPTASVIVLHGLGADGSDFVPIVEELDLAGCPAIRFVFPHATPIPITVNGGYVMRGWYDITDRHDPFGNSASDDDKSLRHSQAAIESVIEEEIARGVAPEKIVLAGFSQGCAMTLQTGLRYPKKLGGMLGLSGYLPLMEETQTERNPANQSTPIFLAHGISDNVVPMSRAEQSRDLLQQLGYQVEWHQYPMAHSVSREEIDDIGAWLRKVLA